MDKVIIPYLENGSESLKISHLRFIYNSISIT